MRPCILVLHLPDWTQAYQICGWHCQISLEEVAACFVGKVSPWAELCWPPLEVLGSCLQCDEDRNEFGPGGTSGFSVHCFLAK